VLSVRSDRIVRWIGDDCAVLRASGYAAVSTDVMVDGTHFRLGQAAPADIGHRALAAALSDLAAMGAAPAYALLALALPPWALEGADEMLEAYAEAAQQYGIEIIGGDFSRAEKLTISVTAIGRIVTRPLLRSGARPGDRVYLSRPIGGSGAGFALLGKDAAAYEHREFVESAIRRHVDPEPEVALGLALAQISEVTSCIDVSDGLSTDLHHLCDASQCGAEIEKERIPVFSELPAYGRRLGIDVASVVLHGGEEYALLFTSSISESQLSARLGRPVYAIGRITKERGVLLKEDGVARPLEPRGFDHFE